MQTCVQRWKLIVFGQSALAALAQSWNTLAMNSVTRLGDLLDFGQVFKAFGNN